MPEIPAPNPAAAARAVKGKFGKYPPWVYALIFVGVAGAVYMLRRANTTPTVPETDPYATPAVPDSAVGSFQGYDSPQDTNITGKDLLDFALAVRDQNLMYRDQDMGLATAQLDATAAGGYTGGATGGGLPADPIPNPPAPRVQAPAPKVPVSTPCPKGYPNRSDRGCYKNCGHDECRNHRRVRNHGHCYQNGQRITVNIEQLGGKC